MTPRIENEQAVREGIIAPILQHLNYSVFGPNLIRHEVTLVYPHEFLGRKKPRTDPPLKGKADYLCQAGGKVAWTIEAKRLGIITPDDVEQAYTYAKHPEIRAVYFCVCNGAEFRVYDTNVAPSVDPLLVVRDCHDSRAAALKLSQLLGVEALLARHAVAVADTKPPIGRGVWSFAQVTGGQIVHDEDVEMPALRGFTVSVRGGAIQRTNEGSLAAYFEGRAPYSAIQATIDRLGLSRVLVYSESHELSRDPACPTLFGATMATVFPAGEKMFDISRHTSIVLPASIAAEVGFEAAGTLDGAVFAGRFALQCAYRMGGPDVTARMQSRGAFEFLLK